MSFFFFSFSSVTFFIVVINLWLYIGHWQLYGIQLSFFFFSVTFFIVINLCLYVGILQFCGVSLSLSLYFLFSFSNFNFKKLIISFLYIYSFVCFSYCSFPLQLIFKIYKSSLSTSITFHIYSFFLFFLSFPLNIFVSFIFIALFPNWHLALILFSSSCFS